MSGDSTVVPFPRKGGGDDGGSSTLHDLIGGLDNDMAGIGAQVSRLSWNGQSPDWQKLDTAMEALIQRLALIRELMSDGAA